MAHTLDDTIAAIASASGGAARGIVRLSGPNVLACLRGFQGEPPVRLDEVRVARALPGRFDLPGYATPLPCDVYLWPNARSYTRQPLAELHTLGSPPLLEAVLRTVCEAGARVASPGEFTLRAFLAGRIDLVEAEAVLGVIDAGGRDELQTALAQLAGGVSRPLSQLREHLLDLVAHLEAGLDFVEEDIEFITADELQSQLAEAERQVAEIAAQMVARSESQTLPRVALVGRPNTGKSSLFNALSQRQAIVSAVPGTTRDFLLARVDLDGVFCELVDTAGIELAASASDIDTAAQEMTRRQQTAADLQILCLDASCPMDGQEREQVVPTSTSPRLTVLTKADLPRQIEYDGPAIATSSATREGLAELRAAIRETLANSGHAESGVVAGTAVRCRDSLRRAAECLARSRELVQFSAGEELLAVEIRAALDELGQVVGAVYTDDVLNRIFSRFCIGK